MVLAAVWGQGMVVVAERGGGVVVAAVWGEGVVPAVRRGAGRRSMDCRESGGAVDGSGGGGGEVLAELAIL